MKQVPSLPLQKARTEVKSNFRLVWTSSFSIGYFRSGWRTAWWKVEAVLHCVSCWSHFLLARSVFVKRPWQWWGSTCQSEGNFWEVQEAKTAVQHSAGPGSVATVAPSPRGVLVYVDTNGERLPGYKNPCSENLTTCPWSRLEAGVQPPSVHTDPAR